MMVGYRRHIDDTIAAYIRNAEMTEFSGAAEAKIIEANSNESITKCTRNEHLTRALGSNHCAKG
jgi:hypothetical protein